MSRPGARYFSRWTPASVSRMTARALQGVGNGRGGGAEEALVRGVLADGVGRRLQAAAGRADRVVGLAAEVLGQVGGGPGGVVGLVADGGRGGPGRVLHLRADAL